MLAVTTFNTFIYFFFHRRQFLQIFDMILLIFIDYHSGVQQIIRVDACFLISS